MRNTYAIVFIILLIALGGCTIAAKRSHRTIGTAVARLCIALMFPIFGNLIIVRTTSDLAATIGYYIYFIGMDFVIAALLHFTFKYCSLSEKYKKLRTGAHFFFSIDLLQYALNPLFHNAFSTEVIQVDALPYMRLVPFLGQAYHRAICYGVLAVSMIVYIVKIHKSPRIYSERYSVILITLIVTALWQTLYIFSRTPVDRSMVGFGVCGVLICYFAVYYRPMRLLDRMLAGIASEMPEALYFFDSAGTCIWANAPALVLVNTDSQSLDQIPPKLDEMFGKMEYTPQDWSLRRILGAGEDAKYYSLEKHTVTDDRQMIAGSFISIRDNTEEQLRLKREMYNATHDSLTGLYTREYLYERILEKIQSFPDKRFYIILVDVKNFKIVNDVFSTAFGDYTLKCIAEWIQRDATPNFVYGRLGGDTFGICHPVEELDQKALEEALSRFVVRDGSVEYHVLIHLGVYEVAAADKDVSVMFDRAHLALSTIRDEYQTHIAFYDDAIRKKVLWDQHISSQLYDAIAERQLRPYLQPIADGTGKVVGAEALVRWIHPTDGFMSPGVFIPVFEKNGMIVEVDKYMWRCACEILAGWRKTNPDMFISVNISPKDFYFIDVKAELMKLIAEFQIQPSRLRIEITETIMMNDADDRMKILNDFRQEGFIVEMDDFGSGYSSLNMLKDMPVDVLKIDMKFLSKSKDSLRARTIVRNIIQLSENLGIASLTEGVETEQQYQTLADMGCRLFQGFYFAKPMPQDEFEERWVN